MQTFAFVLILLVAVIASQPLARLVSFVPLPVLQIAVGAALAWPVTGGVHVEIEPELFLLLFIPPLLFGDAWAAPKREYWQLRWPIISLAFGLVFFTIAVLGYALHWLVPALPLSVAFALAAVLSPTDAVAVSSIIDKNLLPTRLLHLLEGESLFNDASGLVMFRFASAAALTGSFSFVEASTSFALALAAGVGAGFVALFLVGKSLRLLLKVDGVAPEAQVLLLVLLPFAAYLIAEHWHGSGILAAVIAGMYLGRPGTFQNLTVSARMLMTSVWTMTSFILNGAIFILLGLQLPAIIRDVPAELTARHWLLQPIGVVVALTICLIALRYIWAVGTLYLGYLIHRLRGTKAPHYGHRVRMAGSIAGVRGAVTLAGVLSLPLVMPDGSPFPARDLAIFLAAGVIICSLVFASIFLPRIVRGLVHEGHDQLVLEERRARVAAAEAAIEHLEGFAVAKSTTDSTVTTKQAVAEGLIASYRRRIAAFEEGETIREEVHAARKAESELRQAAVNAEQNALRGMIRKGDINDETMHKLMQEILLSEALLTTKHRA